MKKALLLVLLSLSFLVNGQELTQDNSNTTVTFKIKNLGLNVDGSFSEVAIESNFNKNDLAHSYINAKIAVKSIDTDNKTRDKHLAEEDFFDVEKHQYIHLKSIEIVASTDGTYMLEADLSIKGTTKRVRIPIDVSEEGNGIQISSGFEINRRDFKVGKGSWVMSDDVRIKVNYQATR